MRSQISEVTLIVVGSTLIILILLTLIIITLFISQKRKHKYTQEKAEMQLAFNEELLRTQLEIQSQTFENISRELHDNVGIIISIAMVHINAIKSDDDSHAVTEARNLLNEAIETLKNISRSLNTDIISQNGLQQSMHEELEKIKRTKIFNVDYNVKGHPFPIDPKQQIILFRIMQESLNNIVKHSGGDRIKADISFEDPNLEVTIADNGKGFDFSSLNNSRGEGLRNMKARAGIIQAGLDIDSKPGSGTTITLKFNRDVSLNTIEG